MITALRRPVSELGRERIGVLLYLPLASLIAAALTSEGRWFALLALPPIVFGPWGIVASTAVLRASYFGLGVGDQFVVTDAAVERVLAGLSPYGVTYPDAMLPNTPFPYGPLALLHSFPVELAASVGIAALLVRRPVTLALYAGVPFSVYLVAAGNNDYMATLLLVGGVLALPRRSGAALIGLSVAWKPYTAVFLPALAPAGAAVVATGFLVAAAAYIPVLWWGIGGFLQSMVWMDALAGHSPLRYLALPLSVTGIRYGLWAGTGALAVLVAGGGVWSLGYLIPLGVMLGVLLERPLEPGRPVVQATRTPKPERMPESRS